MEPFYHKLAEVMEVDEIQAEDDLKSFPEWDSLTVLSVIAMIGSDYRVNLSARDLKSIETARSLYELIGRLKEN